MTMQKHDYEMVSFGIRGAHEDAQALPLIERAAVNTALRGLAVQFAVDFRDMNPRFKVEAFFTDSLGEDDAKLAQLQYQDRIKEN